MATVVTVRWRTPSPNFIDCLPQSNLNAVGTVLIKKKPDLGDDTHLCIRHEMASAILISRGNVK